jgi:hypothetical protein
LEQVKTDKGLEKTKTTALFLAPVLHQGPYSTEVISNCRYKKSPILKQKKIPGTAVWWNVCGSTKRHIG